MEVVGGEKDGDGVKEGRGREKRRGEGRERGRGNLKRDVYKVRKRQQKAMVI